MTTNERYIWIDGELFLIVDEDDFLRPASSYDAEPLARALLDNAAMSGRWELERELAGLGPCRQRHLVQNFANRLALGSLFVIREPKPTRLLDAVQVRPLADLAHPDAPALRPDAPTPGDETPTAPPQRPPQPVPPTDTQPPISEAPFDVFDLAWGSPTAQRDSVVELMASTQGLSDGTVVRIDVHEIGANSSHSRSIDNLDAPVTGSKIQAQWTVRSVTPTENIATADQLGPGQSWSAPKFFFTVTVRQTVFGDDQGSGLLELRDFLDVVVRDDDDEPVGERPYRLELADGSERSGSLTTDGLLSLKDLPPGPLSLELQELPKA